MLILAQVLSAKKKERVGGLAVADEAAERMTAHIVSVFEPFLGYDGARPALQHCVTATGQFAGCRVHAGLMRAAVPKEAT